MSKNNEMSSYEKEVLATSKKVRNIIIACIAGLILLICVFRCFYSVWYCS